MALTEKTSKHLGVPFVEIEHEGERKYLCYNGVLFKDSEYLDYADLNAEYERREKEDKLYDYAYAKSTGILRKKRSYQKAEETNRLLPEKELSGDTERTSFVSDRQVTESKQVTKSEQDRVEADENGSYRQKEIQGRVGSVLVVVALLAFTSVISMYISTLHTATYLYDYVDIFSAWLMSASVTAYNSTAFEVSVIFKKRKRYGLTFVFISLWSMVTLFSMATTVSVFYDQFNFSETQIAEENKEADSSRLAVELLQKKEKDLRESIDFKKKDIQYRQEKDYATTAVRIELENLQKELQKNLTEQQKVLEKTPEADNRTEIKRKESIFAFLGRILHIDSGIMEFTMSTLSAIFVNLISPLSLTAVVELMQKKRDELDKSN